MGRKDVSVECDNDRTRHSTRRVHGWRNAAIGNEENVLVLVMSIHQVCSASIKYSLLCIFRSSISHSNENILVKTVDFGSRGPARDRLWSADPPVAASALSFTLLPRPNFLRRC